MQRFASALQKPLGSAAYSGAVGLSVTTLGFISAALMSYLWTTMRGRDLWGDRGQVPRTPNPDLKGLTVAEAKGCGRPALALFVDAEGADANGDVKRQTPGARCGNTRWENPGVHGVGRGGCWPGRRNRFPPGGRRPQLWH